MSLGNTPSNGDSSQDIRRGAAANLFGRPLSFGILPATKKSLHTFCAGRGGQYLQLLSSLGNMPSIGNSSQDIRQGAAANLFGRPLSLGF